MMYTHGKQYSTPDFTIVRFELADVVAIDISVAPPPDDQDAVIVW